MYICMHGQSNLHVFKFRLKSSSMPFLCRLWSVLIFSQCGFRCWCYCLLRAINKMRLFIAFFGTIPDLRCCCSSFVFWEHYALSDFLCLRIWSIFKEMLFWTNESSKNYSYFWVRDFFSLIFFWFGKVEQCPTTNDTN